MANSGVTPARDEKQALQVLLTIQTLERPAGGSLYVRDFACELFRQGHRPAVYCRRLGSLYGDLISSGIPVVDTIDTLKKPDIIHGNSPIETSAAILRFPDTPAIFVAHGWGSPDALPPKFPAVMKYLAISEHARDSLIYFHGIPEDRITLHQNPVDLQRFRRRSPLPERPRRALVLSNSITEANQLGAIQAACATAGIKLDVVGVGMGSARLDPENIIGFYDVVFGIGRAALEALASGCAAILAHATGIGELITVKNYDALRSKNFGLFTLPPVMEPKEVADQLRRYDPADAAAVTEKVRRCEGLDGATRVLVEHYREAIRDFRQQGGTIDWSADRLAASRFLDAIAPKANTFFLEEQLAPVEQRARSAEAKLRLLAETLGMNALPQGELAKVRIELRTTVTNMEADGFEEVIVQVVNGSGALLSSFGECPFCLSYHWLSDAGDVVTFEGIRSDLYPPLAPGGSFQYRLRVQAPSASGRFVLRVTAVQERVVWLDQMGTFDECCVNVIAVPPMLPAPMAAGDDVDVRRSAASKSAAAGTGKI